MVQKPQRLRLSRDEKMPLRQTQPKEIENMPVNRDNPYPKFNFQVDLGNGAIMGFSECSGLESETDVIDYREGGDKFNIPRKLPGLTKFSNITLRRGFTASNSLYDWRQKVIDGQTERRNLTITLLDETRQPVYSWIVRNAWPCRLSAPKLVAGESGVAVEEVVICHEGYTAGK